MKKKYFLFAFVLVLLSQHMGLCAQVEARLVAYNPAPGQFINELPVYVDGNDSVDMADAAQACVGDNSLVSLGGFGGHVIFKLSAPIQNVAGKADFSILGNSFAGSSEPGIVSVSIDENKNGLPDDVWYELEGSEWNNDSVIRNYAVTYYRPTPETDAATGDFDEYMRWKDNQGASGWLPKNRFHVQNYYPLWYGDSVTLTGTLLPNNSFDQSGNGTYWVLPGRAWGYVDNRPNEDLEQNSFHIDRARTATGELAHLNRIDFIKVHCAVHAVNGWLGETSTEIQSVQVISPKYIPSGLDNVQTENDYVVSTACITFEHPVSSAVIMDMAGCVRKMITAPTHVIPIAHLGRGIYLLRTEHRIIKFIK